MEEEDLPAAVTQGLKSSKYKKWEISEAFSAETPDYKMLYMLEVQKKKQSKELYFSPEGELIKAE